LSRKVCTSAHIGGQVLLSEGQTCSHRRTFTRKPARSIPMFRAHFLPFTSKIVEYSRNLPIARRAHDAPRSPFVPPRATHYQAVFSQPGPLMKLTHIMSKFFLNHIVSEAAKTFGKSQQRSFALSGLSLAQISKQLGYQQSFGEDSLSNSADSRTILTSMEPRYFRFSAQLLKHE
jgi:hypothetical protein